MPAQTLAISSTKMHSVILSAPMPPYSSGKTMPSSPSSPSLGMISTGNFSLRSASSTSGSDLGLGELADHLAQVFLLLREGVAQHAATSGGSGPSPRSAATCGSVASLPAMRPLDWPTVADPFRLDGRTVIVTGASRGIGAEVARGISAQGGGVVVVARCADALGRSSADAPGPLTAIVGDVADTEVVGEAVAAAEELGRLWGVVNNAGINPFYHPVIETPLSEWDEVLRVNLLGAAAFARAVGRYLTEAGTGGRIINLGSIAGLTGLPNIGPYNASKAALDALTRTLAVELGPAGHPLQLGGAGNDRHRDDRGPARRQPGPRRAPGRQGAARARRRGRRGGLADRLPSQ